MLYSSAGLLALVINLVINHDVLWSGHGRGVVPAYTPYRLFLLAVTAYYATDMLWGILYEHGLVGLAFLDTAAYFLAMACSILSWTQYVVAYLADDGPFGRALTCFGWALFVFEMVMLAMNFFLPVLFSFDASGAYHAEPARYITLVAQIIMFLLTTAYALHAMLGSRGTMRFRHLTIALFGLAMAGFIIGQAFFPLLPLYALGCMLGTVVLHSFVLENEREEYRDALEERLRENILKGNYYDLLTGLAGMSHFFELAQRDRERMRDAGSTPAFVFLDLSGMKFYNQTYGFVEGDRMLRAFSKLLVTTFGEEGCSRFGQDHFVAFAPEEGLDERLGALLAEWDSRPDADLPAVRAGVYVDRGDGVDVSAACDRAKVACDAIRTSYVSAVRRYDDALLTSAEQRHYILSHVDRAVEEGWIQVYYHPIVRAGSGRMCDEEALARWMDPERGFLSPADFIPILEEGGLIYKLDLCVVEQVLYKIRLLQEAGLPVVPQSVNLSRSDFDSCDMVEQVRQRVDAAGVSPRLMSIEITESAVGSDFDFIKEQVERFRALGFPVWMDDFGSGYSSLDVLSNMEVDLIKLDMRFMQQFDHGRKSRVILTELMRMAAGLGIDTVCEGVERRDQVEFLRGIGCSKLQGYYFARPMPLSDAMARLASGEVEVEGDAPRP